MTLIAECLVSIMVWASACIEADGHPLPWGGVGWHLALFCDQKSFGKTKVLVVFETHFPMLSPCWNYIMAHFPSGLMDTFLYFHMLSSCFMNGLSHIPHFRTQNWDRLGFWPNGWARRGRSTQSLATVKASSPWKEPMKSVDIPQKLVQHLGLTKKNAGQLQTNHVQLEFPANLFRSVPKYPRKIQKIHQDSR